MDGWELSADRDGIASMADLRRAGLDHRDIHRLVRAGRIVTLARGWLALRQPESDEAKHVLATKAMLRSHEGRAVAGHHSGLLLLGLPTYRADLSVVRLIRRDPGSPRTRAGLRLGRPVPPEGQLEHTVVPALAVVQHGLSAGPLSALVAADGLLHQGGSPEDLVMALEWLRCYPRISAVRSILHQADGRHESPGETLLGHLFHTMDLPVIPQFEITAPSFRAVADFVIDGEDVVIEFDGKVKYTRATDTRDPFGQTRSTGQVVWDEKRREDRIRELGCEVVRVVWADLRDPKALEARIRAAIQRARRRRGRLSA